MKTGLVRYKQGAFVSEWEEVSEETISEYCVGKLIQLAFIETSNPDPVEFEFKEHE